MKKIAYIITYLNDKYTQKAVWEEGIVIPKIEKFDEKTVISYWECGAIVSVDGKFYFIRQDDLYWYFRDMNTGINSAHLKSLGDAITRLAGYLQEHGKPFYYTGTNIICGYKL